MTDISLFLAYFNYNVQERQYPRSPTQSPQADLVSQVDMISSAPADLGPRVDQVTGGVH